MVDYWMIYIAIAAGAFYLGWSMPRRQPKHRGPLQYAHRIKGGQLVPTVWVVTSGTGEDGNEIAIEAVCSSPVRAAEIIDSRTDRLEVEMYSWDVDVMPTGYGWRKEQQQS